MAEHQSEASDGLDPEEPHTPFWLTLLGGALFLAGAIFLLGTADEEAAADPGAQAVDAAPGAADAGLED